MTKRDKVPDTEQVPIPRTSNAAKKRIRKAIAEHNSKLHLPVEDRVHTMSARRIVQSAEAAIAAHRVASITYANREVIIINRLSGQSIELSTTMLDELLELVKWHPDTENRPHVAFWIKAIRHYIIVMQGKPHRADPPESID